ncbi:MAG: FAD-binding oxidoreductase [Acidimicrobiales bacterium]
MTSGLQVFDVAIIGGGIAGVSAAYHLAPTHQVVLLEQEAELAFHTTSRSAAIYLEGGEVGGVNSRLSIASRAFLERDHADLDAMLLSPLGALDVGPEELTDQLTAQAAATSAIVPSIELVDSTQIRELCPVLRPERSVVGVWEPNAKALDAMALHQLFLRGARRNGAEIARSSRVIELEYRGRQWLITTTKSPVRAKVVVNAAGAWGDVVGIMAGAKPLGLQPCRRTALTTTVRHEVSRWPFVYTPVDEGACYFRPETGQQLLCSLADETRSEPCDARAEELDVALALDHLNALTTLDIRTVNISWAGLRTFAPDRSPVLGWDRDVADFCWMVGQGGSGILTSPAAGESIAAIVGGDPLPDAISRLGTTKSDLAART